jgi:homoserine O-acetyltransferase/O-succinyltransferase
VGSIKQALVAATTAVGLAAAAHGQTPVPPVSIYSEGALRLESGQSIENFSIAYVTHGTLNASRSNAILVATAIGANHHRLDYLIGPGKALDTDRYFIIATNAIGNGLSTSPSNSMSQPGMSFPRFSIRDMVESQYRLVKEKWEIAHLFAVVGVSMGGMQTLQWGVSHPDMMDALVAIVPLGRTPPWTRAVLAFSRDQITSDPAWRGGNYTAAPEAGLRLRAGTMALITRTPELLKDSIPTGNDAGSWLHKAEDDTWMNVDARDWIYQSWAYDAHDVGATPGFSGDYYAALHSIRAATLILAGVGDLLNPESEALELAQHIPGARFASIKPRGPAGHYSASGQTQPEVDFLNRTIGGFLSAHPVAGRGD